MKKKYLVLLLCCSLIFKSTVAQNVGIGTAAPTEKLTVAGNVQANAFKYATPKTLYYSVNEAAYRARAGSDVVYCSTGNGGAYVLNGSNYGLSAPVNLPQGATITQITCQFYDNSPTQDLSMYFVQAYESGYSFDATITSTGSAGLNIQTYTFPVPETIDNSYSSYELFVVPASGSWTSFDLQIRSVIFQYTLAETN